jgi:hypothetical protein
LSSNNRTAGQKIQVTGSLQPLSRKRSNVEAVRMKEALRALRELRATGHLRGAKPASEPLTEVVGLVSGAMLGSAVWILLLRLTWFG